MVKQTEAIDGVSEAYLYTSTQWYGDRLEFGAMNPLVKGKVVTLKVRMSEVSTIFFAVNYVNSYDGNNWTFGDKILYYTSDNKIANTLVADTWYTVVVDLTGTENCLWYYTLDAGKSMYIADLQILDENLYPQATNIDKYLKTSASLVRQTEAIGGVEDAYLYTSTQWYGDRLEFGAMNPLVKGKVVTLKVRMSEVSTIFFAVNYVNSYDGNNWTFGDKILYYTSDNKIANTLVADTWYTVVVDLTGTENCLWYYTLDAGKSMYIADLQILDQNPFTQNA